MRRRKRKRRVYEPLPRGKDQKKKSIILSSSAVRFSGPRKNPNKRRKRKQIEKGGEREGGKKKVGGTSKKLIVTALNVSAAARSNWECFQAALKKERDERNAEERGKETDGNVVPEKLTTRLSAPFNKEGIYERP